MTWFNKAIAYDQKKKLLALPIVDFIPILLLIIDLWNDIVYAEEIKRPLYTIFSIENNTLIYLIILLFFVGVAAVSIGIRDKSERGYMVSMPIKKESNYFN